jgi:predicted transcriptional regulator
MREMKIISYSDLHFKREWGHNMKTLHIGTASYKDIKARTMDIARDKLKPSAKDPKVWFTSAESFARVLSDKNRALLEVIAESHPDSLTELAEMTGREKANLSRTLKTMEQYGLVSLKKTEEGKIVPHVLYESISLTLPVGQSA